MANYVANKVVCSKSFYEKYFLDPNPFGEEIVDEYMQTHPYITFNKLFSVKSTDEYWENYGTDISYGYGFSVDEIDNDMVVIKFQTRWYYPIQAIIRTIQLDHSIEWYCVEENAIYLSKFCWMNESVVDLTLYREDEFYDAYDKMSDEEYDSLDDCDDLAWHLDWNNAHEWRIWETDNLVERYDKHYPAKEYYRWLEGINKGNGCVINTANEGVTMEDKAHIITQTEYLFNCDYSADDFDPDGKEEHSDAAEKLLATYSWEDVFPVWNDYLHRKCKAPEEAINFANLFFYYGGHDHPIPDPYSFLGYFYYVINFETEKYDPGDILDSLSITILPKAGYTKADLMRNPYYMPENDPKMREAAEQYKRNHSV